ncbi:AraC family transcriptional regulator [Wenyingzhuangia fucanilytica]|uniref:AraC family transcriptional regulator n=1 Tax=Wenyingzhuangia fucanilytica TaxID=1790137 RepID=A0A1B1Y538_9FLAO|nr:AraC family transcriptional regulator [Wenyingzhuangia fucanilytica]ANW95896.1 AraC family transcriptional regulator [Wenyingzhuangia fucanilytica]
MYKSIENLSISLLNVGYVNLNEAWDFENVISPFFRLYYITDGDAYVYHHQKRYDLKPGYMYLIPSFTYSHYKCSGSMSQYYISALEVSTTGVSVFSVLNFLYEIEGDEFSLMCFKRILELNPNRTIVKDDPKVYDNPTGLDFFRNENKKLSESTYLETRDLLLALLSKFISSAKEVDFTDKTSKIGRIANYIEINLATEITVKDLADVCHLNVDYFSRLFKQTYHIRPNEYIQKKRVERAQLLLIASSDSLKEIADKVGFTSVTYFSRVFKKHTKKSPLQYRKEQWTFKKE